MTAARPTILEQAWQALDERDARIAQLEGLVASLMAKVDEMARQLAQNSSNSSKPPSSDGPSGAPPNRPKTGRRPGGQKGHKGHRRALVERPDVVLPAIPAACAGCGHALHGRDPKPSRHQVTDLPPLRPVVTEYQRHRLRCSCGHVTEADWPSDMPSGAFGPHLTALVGYLGAECHLSHDQTQHLCRDVFGVSMARGSVWNYRGHVATALRSAHEETAAAVQRTDHAHLDETPQCPHGRGGWVWIAVCAEAVHFVCAQDRSHVVATQMLGDDFRGLVTTDQHGAYNVVAEERRQLCWAHLQRAFVELSERPGLLGSVGEDLVRQTQKLFRWWHQLRAGRQLRVRWVQRMKKLRGRVERLLAQGAALGEPLSGRCAQLLEQRASLWTFVRHEGLEPTNNAAERALRPLVVWRKKSFGPRSDEGRRFVERVASVVATLRCRGQSAWTYLTRAMEAWARQVAAPKLLAQGP